ncbi:MAG TPA: response regulator [Phycisphaerae bacterium]|nr:response regulator [Phycisphaerae bacterium]
MRILHAEDDATSRTVIRHILAAERTWRITEAPDGQAAWELLDGGMQPDLCLVDIKMPRMNGHELVQRMRSDVRYANLPVVILSSVREKEMVLLLARLRISAYLLKPYVADRVLKTVRQVLRSNVMDSLMDPSLVIGQLQLTPGRYLEQLINLLASLDSRMAEARGIAERGDRPTAAKQVEEMAADCLRLGAVRFEQCAVETAQILRTSDGGTSDLYPLEEELMNLQAACERLKDSETPVGRVLLAASRR